MKLSEDDKEVQQIVQQMYGQREQVGKISSFAGYMNMEQLKRELYDLGWIARLKDDQMSIYLEPISEHPE